MENRIVNILINQDKMSLKDAQERVKEVLAEANDRLTEGDIPYDICEEYFGLEPDYLDDLFSFREI